MIRLKKKNKSDKKKSENPFRLKFNFKEKTIVLLLFIAASLAIFFSAAILYTLFDGAIPFFEEISLIDFLTGTKWLPTASVQAFGVLPLVANTLIIAGGALLIGAPLGVAAAIYLSEFASDKLRAILKPIIELLAGIPSIVFAFFALMFIRPIFVDNFDAGYFNAISAIIVVAIMLMPIIISISDDAMKAVPNHLRQTSLAVGATKWETATKIVMPAASSGIIASILLGLARGIGETMIVLMVAGGRIGYDLFDQMLPMSGYIGRVATGDMPPGLAHSAAFAVGIVLFIIAYAINSLGARIVLQIKTGSTVKSKKIKKEKSENQNKLYSSISKLFFMIVTFFLFILLKIRSLFALIKSNIWRTKQLTLSARYLKQRIGVSLIASSIIIAVVFLIILLGYIFSEGISGLTPTFLTSYPSRFPEKAGIFPVLMGTIYLMLLTMVIATPIGIGAAIYLNEFAKDNAYTKFLRRMIQNLAGVPSIVFGLLGYLFFAHVLGFGMSLLSASLVLSIMILPIIVVSTEEALKSVPDSFREAARGVGSTRWQTVRHHVLPNAIPGMLTGIILSLSRAIGETAPILFLVSYFGKTAPSGVMDGFMSLPSQIFYWSQHAKAEFQILAASAIIVLLLILLAMNTVAIIIRQRAQAKRDW
jgi:phosphate ABC transporter permease subunit PstA/phosphate ABC transporter permease protein PstC